MNTILDYIRIKLEESKKFHVGASDYEDLSFTVAGEPKQILTFDALRDRLDKKDGSFLFDPIPQEKNGKPHDEFSVLQIQKIPDKKALPGLLLKHEDKKLLLIHHPVKRDLATDVEQAGLSPEAIRAEKVKKIRWKRPRQDRKRLWWRRKHIRPRREDSWRLRECRWRHQRRLPHCQRNHP